MTSTHELGITVGKNENFGEWYQQIITKCKLIDYYDISGFYVLLPNAYCVWENIQKYLDSEFKLRDVKNVYFPLLITRKNLEAEQNHIEGFSAEVMWVTKLGNTDLTQYKLDEDGNKIESTRDESNYLAIRPTSECAIYPIIGNHINSYMDLPLKYNQWCSVVRSEFNSATAFIRSKEFLWQEGHTCHRSRDLAMQEVNDILELYKQTYKNVLAIPMIKGYKTQKEKFAGADVTTTIETYIPGANRAIQAATSHCLGQNFSKLFDITYTDENSVKQYVWQNSWGFTTRSIGIMLMTHSDNKGVVYPPIVAPIQIVILPIIFKDSKDSVMNYVQEVYTLLKQNFRVHVDINPHHNVGYKQNYWEVMGAPIKLEIGPKDCQKRTVRAVRRDSFEKTDFNFDSLTKDILTLFGQMHNNLYGRAETQLQNAINRVQTWAEFMTMTSNHQLCLVPFCNQVSCEDTIKEESGAKSLCIPTDPEYILNITDKVCIKCSSPANTHCLFGRSY